MGDSIVNIEAPWIPTEQLRAAAARDTRAAGMLRIQSGRQKKDVGKNKKTDIRSSDCKKSLCQHLMTCKTYSYELYGSLWISMATALRPASPEPRLTSLERKLREGQETETSILRQSGIRRITSNHQRFGPLIRWSACRNRRSMPSSFVGLRSGKLCVGSWSWIILCHPIILCFWSMSMQRME